MLDASQLLARVSLCVSPILHGVFIIVYGDVHYDTIAASGGTKPMLSWWMWMILGLVLLACEMLTPGLFYCMFLGISALLAGLAAWMAPNLPEWVPWVLFSIFSAVSLAFFRKPLMEKFKLSGKHGHKVDSLVGETALALEEIGPGAIGKVELRGASWTAQNSGNQPIQRSARPKVERVEGLTLYVRNP